MNLHTRRMAWMGGLALIVVPAIRLLAQPATQPEATTQPAASKAKPVASAAGGDKLGKITGDNVYIRSGFAATYYPVTKLNRGDSVTILGEEFGWLKILPPAGTHSLVEKTFVNRLDDKAGTLNDARWALAGSNLDNRRYAKQVKLNKGDKVQIIGETTDGAYLKIEPPPGACLWVKADFVDRGGGAPTVAGKTQPKIEPVKTGELDLTKVTEPDKRTAAKSTEQPKPPKKVDTVAKAIEDEGKYQPQIDAIEAEITAESAKPAAERDYTNVLSKLQPLADQTTDEVTGIYAKARVEQLRGYMELTGAAKTIRGLTEDAITNADNVARERGKLRVKQVDPMEDIAVRGEIRVSGAYDGSGGRLKLWRVVDATGGPMAKTIAYLEVPQGSPIDPMQYYGRFIGVRASSRRTLSDTIPPMTIYTVQEIFALDPTSGKAMPAADSGTLTASPPAAAIAPPASQPATTAPESESKAAPEESNK